MKKLISILILALFTFLGMAQTQTGYVEIKGKVKKGGKSLSAANIDVYENSTKIKSVKTESNGRFILNLAFDKTYIIEFSKKSYVSKKVSFDTHVREKQYVWPYPFTIELFEMVDGLDVSALNDPVTKISYSEEEGDFAFDISYTSRMKSKIAKIQNQIKTLEKNAYASKVAAADKKFREKDYEKAIILYEQAIDINPYTDYPDDQIMECERRLANKDRDEANYKKLIANGDSYFKNKQYEQAKKAYSGALKVFSDKPYPKEKINEINALIAQQGEQERKDRYNQIIKQADAFLTSQDFENAKVGYQKALEVIPTEEYPKGRIAEIDARLADLERDAKVEATYNEKIQEGDRLFTKMEYQISRNAYVSASKIKPNEQYPKDRIAAIDNKMSQMEEDRNYADKIKNADANFAQKQLENAKVLYREALAIKPSESYPKNKIAEIDGLLAEKLEQKELDRKYSEFISKADNSFASKDYNNAKTSYQSALELKPTEKYPKNKITEIEGYLSKLEANQAKEKQYSNLIQNADLLLSENKFNKAKQNYTDALKIKPSEEYPKAKISEIDALLGQILEQENLDKAYKEKIKLADIALSKQKYNEAKSVYQSAIQLKPSESYPKDKIKEIDAQLALINEQNAKEKQFNDLIAKADQEFGSEAYASAKTSYQEALKVKPDAKYAQNQISEIEKRLKLIAENQAKEDEYQNKIKQGDANFTQKKYENAKTNYLAALSVKPKASYPQSKIQEIDNILANLADEKQKNELYTQHIQNGDAKFNSKKYTEAKMSFQSALKIKPTEQYPKNKIAEIEGVEKQLAEREALDKEYQVAISKADAFLNKKDLRQARAKYEEALQIKSNESYPKEKITEIDALIKTLASQKAKEERYNALMSSGGTKFKAQKYQSAKADYEAALKLKPEENLPQKKINEINEILNQVAEQKAKDERYVQLINLADNSFNDKDYQSAKKKYQEALQIKSNESYPTGQISKIDGLLAQIEQNKALDKKYNAAILKADAFMSKKDYVKAKPAYEAALKIKPSEQYPKEKISEIDSALAAIEKKKQDAKAKEDNYKAKLAEGDRLLAKREYKIAKKAFIEALDIKPNESYPKEKIAVIDEKLALMAKDVEYSAKLKEGSELLTKKKYEEAKLAFVKASELKPAESYPKDQIKAIDQIIARNAVEAQKLADYKAFIKQANEKFEAQSYTEAQDLYKKALNVNKSAKFPKDRIAEINKILAEQTAQANLDAKKAKYAGYVLQADQEFSDKEYKKSKTTYQSALDLMPDEAYPKARIKEIDDILAAEVAEIPEEIDFSNIEEKKKFMSTMAKKYGEGVHEENYKSKSGKTVRRIIVVNGGLADEYREVKQPWGATYFFKNGKNIGRSIFLKETKE